MGSAEDGRTSGGNPGSACNRRPGTGVKTPVLPTVAPTDCIPNCNALLCCNCGQDSRRHVLIDNTRSLPPMGGGVGPGFPRQKTHSRSQQQQEKERLLQEAGSSRACYKIETGGGIVQAVRFSLLVSGITRSLPWASEPGGSCPREFTSAEGSVTNSILSAVSPILQSKL